MMLALLIAASVLSPPGTQGAWEGSKPGFKIEMYQTGLTIDYETPTHSGGSMCEFVSATSKPRQFVVRCGWQMYGDVIFNEDGSLTFNGWRLDIDATTYPISDRFTRKGLSDS